MSTAPSTKPLYYWLHICSPFSPIQSIPRLYLPAQHRAPPSLLQGDAAGSPGHSYAYLSQSHNICSYVHNQTETERDSDSVGNATASARRCKRLTVSRTAAGAIWSALRVPVGHLPTLAKASSTTMIYTLWLQEHVRSTVQQEESRVIGQLRGSNMFRSDQNFGEFKWKWRPEWWEC